VAIPDYDQCACGIIGPHEKHRAGWLPEYTDKELFKRALRNARPRACGTAPRWVAVMDTFAVGSTVAADICRKHDLAPDEFVPGPRCLACNP